MTGACSECGRDTGVRFTCSRCRAGYCYHHRDPDAHDCPGATISTRFRHFASRVRSTARRTGKKLKPNATQLSAVLGVLLVAVFVAGLIGTGIPVIDQTAAQGADGFMWLVISHEDDTINKTVAEQEFLQQLNAERSARGLDNLSTNSELREMGDAHAENMLKHDYGGHVQPDGTTIEDRYHTRGLLPDCRLSAGGREYYNGAENAAGFRIRETVTHPGTTEYFYIDSEEELAAFLLDSWMTSEGHRRVLLLESADEIGLGLAWADSGQGYAALEFC